jgi:hypothetical protein
MRDARNFDMPEGHKGQEPPDPQRGDHHAEAPARPCGGSHGRSVRRDRERLGTIRGPSDDKLTGPPIPYVRHDGKTDASIDACNDTEDPEAFGAYTQNNEPFSVVDPSNPDLVVTGWNDYCGDWMGLGFSTDGGQTWTDSLVPGYPADTSPEGMASPEFGRTNEASDPVAAFSADGSMFYFGFLAYNGSAGPKTNSDVAVARYQVLEPGDTGYTTYPLDYVDTTQVGRGPAAANFFGIFNDKNMIETDQAPASPFEGNVYMCWTKFPANGTPTIRFRASSDGGQTFSPPVNLTEGGAGQGCDITVEADGDVYVIWRDFEFSSSHKNFGVSFARSTDGGLSFSREHKIRNLDAYNPFDTARDCGDGDDLCPSGFVFARVPLEPRITSDPTGKLPGVFAIYNAVDPATEEPTDTTYTSAGFGTGLVGRSFVYVAQSLNDGQTWSPVKVAGNVPTGTSSSPTVTRSRDVSPWCGRTAARTAVTTCSCRSETRAHRRTRRRATPAASSTPTRRSRRTACTSAHRSSRRRSGRCRSTRCSTR